MDGAVPLLSACFGIDSRVRVIALVGAGGKTSLMYALAREMVAGNGTVITTTTTKIKHPEPSDSAAVLLKSDDPHLARLPGLLKEFRHVTVAQSLRPDEKLEGLTPECTETLLGSAQWVVIEADGASGCSIKAPEEWEPVIPAVADLVVPVVGLDCLGKPAEAPWVFRSARFLEVTGLGKGELITPQTVARLLVHPRGGLKSVPQAAAVVPFLNKRDAVTDDAEIEELAAAVGIAATGRITRIVVAAVKGGVPPRVYDLTASPGPTDTVS